MFSGRKRSGVAIERWCVLRGTKHPHPLRLGEALKPSRGGVRHVPGSTVPHSEHEAQVGCAAKTWRCQAFVRREPLLERETCQLAGEVEALGGGHWTTNGHELEQVKAQGQPERWRFERAGRDGIGCCSTAGMREARQQGSFGDGGVE
jgi:hypothetical protein